MLSSLIRTRLKGGRKRQRQGEQVGEKQSAVLVLLSKPSGQGLARTPEPSPVVGGTSPVVGGTGQGRDCRDW